MEDRMEPLVSIITVNYNQSKVSCDLLASLRNISYKNIEVFVVDNGSPNDTPDQIKELYPEIHLIKSDENLGFAGGNNLAIKEAGGKYCLFINNDTEVTEGFLEPLVDCLEKNPKIGMVSPKIRFHHSPDIIQYAGYTPLNPYTMRQDLIGYRQKDTGNFNQSGPTYSIHGAAMMVPMSVIREVGMMADIFFLYYEEHDWAYRIRKAGYDIHFIAESLIYHKESISTGKESPLKIYYIARNRVLFMRRNFSGAVYFLCVLYLVFIAIPKNSLVYLVKRRFDLFVAFWKAMIWNLTHYKGLQFNPKLN